MKRGLLVLAVVVAESLVAAACAFAFSLFFAFATGYAQRSGYMHGGGPPATAKEQAAIHAAGVTAFVSSFSVILAAELASTAGALWLVRRARRLRPTDSVDRAALRARPLGLWFIAAAFSYSVCAGLTLAFFTSLLGTFAPSGYVVLAIELVAGVVGLWLALTRQPVPRTAVVCCAVPLCVASYFTIPPVGPSLIIWPIALIILLTNDSVRDHFDHSPATLPTDKPGRRA